MSAAVAANHTAGLATRPGLFLDPDGRAVPPRIAAVLAIVGILSEYGRHMLATVEHRALWRGFATIAQYFGTASVATILAHLSRGIMRAVALERLLLRRAALGIDLKVQGPRERSPRQPSPVAGQGDAARTQAAPSAEASPPAPAVTAARRPAGRRGAEAPLTLDTLPSMAEIEAQVRRRPIGQTIVEICHDLGVSFSLCSSTFGDQVFTAIRWYRGSLNRMLRDMRERERRYEKTEVDRNRQLGWPEQAREEIRRVLGFFVGEPPVDPFRPSPPPGATPAAAATGPP